MGSVKNILWQGSSQKQGQRSDSCVSRLICLTDRHKAQSLANFVAPHEWVSFTSASGFLATKKKNTKKQQREFDHNHIFHIYHHILYIVAVVSNIRGHRELLSLVSV